MLTRTQAFACVHSVCNCILHSTKADVVLSANASLSLLLFYSCRRIAKSNGIALWMEHQYGEGNGSIISHGPTAPPSIGAPVLWNRYVKQGVILSIPDIAEISINI